MNAEGIVAAFSEQQVAGFMLVLARISPLFLLAPLFSSKMLPLRARSVIAVALAVGISPIALHAGDGSVPLDALAFGGLILKELLVGVAFAYGLAALFAAVSAAGSFVDALVGFSFGSLVDPLTGNQGGTLNQVYSMVGLAIFVAINGDSWVIQGLARTYDAVPLLSAPDVRTMVQGAELAFSGVLAAALEICAPVVLAMLLTDDARQELRELVARRGYDAVVAFSDPQAWPVVASMRLDGPRVVPVPCVMPHNEGFLRQNLDNLREWRRLLTRVHAPVHSSIGARDARLHRELAIDAEYVPNASEEIPPEGSLRELFGIDPGMPLLLHVSNYSGQKNHVGLLQAIAEHPGEFRLVMAGHPVAGQGRLERDIRRLAAADPRVILAGGLPGELVAAGMREADLLVHPSVSEGAPITVLEAMSCRLPWIATPGCGAVHDHAGGLILPVRQFGAAIDFLLERPDARERLGAAGRAHWEAACTYDVIAERYDALLRGARHLPALEMPAPALAVTEAVRTEFYDGTLADPAAVAGVDALVLEQVAVEAAAA